MEPKYYTYEASEHCPACALERFGENARGEIDGIDDEGNRIGAAFDYSEPGRTLVCGTCNDVIAYSDGGEPD